MKNLLTVLIVVFISIYSVNAQKNQFNPNSSSWDYKESKIDLVNIISALTKDISSSFENFDKQEDSLYLKNVKIDKKHHIIMMKKYLKKADTNIINLEKFLAIICEHPHFSTEEILETKKNLLFFQENILPKRKKDLKKKL